MSVAAGMPGILLPADPGFREARLRDARGSRIRRGAIAGAALAHLLVIAAILIHWPALFVAVPNERPPIPVTLVQAVPAPRAAQPAPPAPPPAPSLERISGADNETTAPPQAPAEGAEAAPKPVPPPPLDTPAKAATTAPPKPEPEPETHAAKPKLATRETAPKPSRGFVNRAPGEQVHEGDPYINRLNELLNEHYHYPADAVGPLGLHLEGTAIILFGVLADGSLQGVSVERSSGSAVLDAEAVKEVEDAAPFPPPPAYLQRDGMALLERDTHYFPGAS
jgi:protein TonB